MIEKGNKDYTGCFVGVELGLSTGNSIYVDGSYGRSKLDDVSSPNINVHFGWQWYYWDNAGFRVKAHLGYARYSGNGIITNTVYDGGVIEGIYRQNAEVSANSLQYGVAIAWNPYDFIYGGEHTLGLHIEEGIEFSTMFGDILVNDTGSNANGSATNFTTTSAIGVHYFYKFKHQFSLDYKYRFYDYGSSIVNARAGVYVIPRSVIYLTYSYMF